MKKTIRTLCLLALCFSITASAENKKAAKNTDSADASSSSSELAYSRPNGLSVEILGRAALYSLQYDRMLEENIAIGIGFETISLSAGTGAASTASVSMTLIPIYANYYFSEAANHFYVTGGTNFISGTGTIGSVTVGATGLGLHSIGVGYEHRGGFLFRIAPMVLIAGSTISPTLGISLGAAF